MSDEQTGLEVIAAAWSPEEVKARVDANKQQENDFPEGLPAFANNSTLRGYPFLIVSHWLERHVEGKRFPSGKEYPAHQVMQVMVRTINPTTYEVYDPELATLTGEYLLNQFRNATTNEYILGGPWTIRANPRFMTKRGTPPDMLARYRPEVDYVPDEQSAFDEPPVTSMLPNSEPSTFNLVTELSNRGLNEAAFLKHTHWQSITGHTEQEYRTALVFIDRTLRLGEIQSGDSASNAARKLAPRR